MSTSRLCAILMLAVCTANAEQAPPPVQVSPLLSKALAEYPGKEAVAIEVTYPPGGGDPVHKHDAHGFIYVLEGSIEMGVRGGKTVTLTPGQTFYEGPDDIHTVGRNTSLTEPARFLVFLLKNSDAPILTPLP
ncbi:cupin [Pseudomonas sp. BAY1663]|uniref:cupin domain-containing protein n=1 Tax=Pseudomonas sp. BAY1663 TaxID=1439940 RepID=UPI00042E01AD|nr:cupin domain-containing protein [Pseudomonas sp. BAY1663]EXF47316.1 cupin [Pseudomonas sp. BAY1663]